MQLSTFFRRRPGPAKDCWPAESGSLFDLWTSDPDLALARLSAEDGFTPSEIDAAALWSARQQEWGLRAAMHDSAAILEVFGPDELVPHCILYPTAGGVQSDEFSGSSTIYPCLEAALQAIAPLH